MDDEVDATSLRPREIAGIEESLRELVLVLPRIVKGLRRQHLQTIPGDVQAVLQKGFSGRHLLALAHLAEAEPLSVSELGERLNVSLPTVSIVVHQLAGYGLIQRMEDPADRRRAIVQIDPVHRSWVDASLQRAAAPLRRTLERLEPEERRTFIQGLTVLAEELNVTDSADHGAEERIVSGRPCD